MSDGKCSDLVYSSVLTAQVADNETEPIEVKFVV